MIEQQTIFGFPIVMVEPTEEMHQMKSIVFGSLNDYAPTCDLCDETAVMGFNDIREIAPTPDSKEPGEWWSNWEVTNDKPHLRCQRHYGHGQKPPERMSIGEIMKHIEGKAEVCK